MTPSQLWLVAGNLVLCGGVVYMAITRLNVTTDETRPVIRAQFALLVGGGLTSGLQWLWGDVPSIGSLIMSAAVCLYMVLGWHRWAAGAPPDTMRRNGTDFMGLHEGGHHA